MASLVGNWIFSKTVCSGYQWMRSEWLLKATWASPPPSMCYTIHTWPLIPASHYSNSPKTSLIPFKVHHSLKWISKIINESEIDVAEYKKWIFLLISLFEAHNLKRNKKLYIMRVNFVYKNYIAILRFFVSTRTRDFISWIS